jgi:NodT family efflux transporter outer membrane factor (OMF) lipoprotein
MIERKLSARRCLTITLSTVALVVGGCTVGPDYKAPATTMPAGWLNASGEVPPPTTQQLPPATAASRDANMQPSVAAPTVPDVARWWENFNDPELNSLVTRAVTANLDLRSAASRIRQARAARNADFATLFPQVNGVGSYTRSRSPGGGANLSRDVLISQGDSWQAGFDATWELDIFGGTRRTVEADQAALQAAIEDRRDVLVTLLSEVALNYVELRGFQKEIAIAQENLVSQRHSADLTRQRRLGGLAAGLDVANADANVATTAADIPPLEQSVQQSIYTISVLLALPPVALENELNTPAPIPATPPLIPVGLPSDLLRRRPDIREAESTLHAATAQIGVATADLFPHFFFNPTVGLQAPNFPGLGDWANHSWSFGPSFTWDVFDAGQVLAKIQVSDEGQKQALLAYQTAVLNALQDVESALIAYVKEQQHRSALADAVEANQRAVKFSTLLYSEGLTDFLNVEDAQRSLYASQNALVQSEQTVSTNLIALYKALGGGWEGETEDQAYARVKDNGQ